MLKTKSSNKQLKKEIVLGVLTGFTLQSFVRASQKDFRCNPERGILLTVNNISLQTK